MKSTGFHLLTECNETESQNYKKKKKYIYIYINHKVQKQRTIFKETSRRLKQEQVNSDLTP
jgi:hypothetical protein